MISVSGKKWEQKKINQNLVEKIKQDYNFSNILSRLIISKKFDNDEIATINTDLDLKNIFLNNEDFIQSIKLVVNSINNNKYTTETLITHKSLKFTKILKRTNLISK